MSASSQPNWPCAVPPACAAARHSLQSPPASAAWRSCQARRLPLAAAGCRGGRVSVGDVKRLVRCAVGTAVKPGCRAVVRRAALGRAGQCRQAARHQWLESAPSPPDRVTAPHPAMTSPRTVSRSQGIVTGRMPSASAVTARAEGAPLAGAGRVGCRGSTGSVARDRGDGAAGPWSAVAACWSSRAMAISGRAKNLPQIAARPAKNFPDFKFGVTTVSRQLLRSCESARCPAATAARRTSLPILTADLRRCGAWPAIPLNPSRLKHLQCSVSTGLLPRTERTKHSLKGSSSWQKANNCYGFGRRLSPILALPKRVCRRIRGGGLGTWPAVDRNKVSLAESKCAWQANSTIEELPPCNASI